MNGAQFILARAGLILLCASRALAQLEVLSPERPATVFGGQTQTVQVLFRNRGAERIEIPMSTRLFQLSSATAMPVNNTLPWKQLTVLAGQTIVDSLQLQFPKVNATTRFEVLWFDGAQKTVGRMPLTV